MPMIQGFEEMITHNTDFLNQTITNKNRLRLMRRFSFYPFLLAFIMHQTPMMMNGMERICPMSSGREASKAS